MGNSNYNGQWVPYWTAEQAKASAGVKGASILAEGVSYGIMGGIAAIAFLAALPYLATAGAASTSTSTVVSGVSYSGGGSAALTMGGSSGTIGAGGMSAGVTWTGVAEAAKGVHTLNMAYLAASQAATVADAAVAKRTKEEESDFASVRFQVQTGKEDIASDRQDNSLEIGVTKAQGYFALSIIYEKALLKDPSLGNNKDFRAAIIKVSEQITAVKGGLIKGPYQTTIQETFYHRKKEYRVDLEVQRGVNFKR